MQEVAMSTQENAVPSSLAHLLIELSRDIEKREEFRRDPVTFLGNHTFNSKELKALLSGDPHQLRSAFGLRADIPGLEGHEDFIRDIVRDEIKKSKKKKPPKKKDKKDKKKKK
jgi:hypothetical protein